MDASPEQIAAKMNVLDWESSFLRFFVAKHRILFQEKEVHILSLIAQGAFPFCPGMLLQTQGWVKAGVLQPGILKEPSTGREAGACFGLILEFRSCCLDFSAF